MPAACGGGQVASFGLSRSDSSLQDLSSALTMCHVWSHQSATDNELNKMSAQWLASITCSVTVTVLSAESEQSRLNGKPVSQLTSNHSK